MLAGWLLTGASTQEGYQHQDQVIYAKGGGERERIVRIMNVQYAIDFYSSLESNLC